MQFEAVQQLTPDEKEVARAVLEGLVLKHMARRWAGASASSATPASTKGAATSATKSPGKPKPKATPKSAPKTQAAPPTKRSALAAR